MVEWCNPEQPELGERPAADGQSGAGGPARSNRMGIAHLDRSPGLISLQSFSTMLGWAIGAGGDAFFGWLIRLIALKSGDSSD